MALSDHMHRYAEFYSRRVALSDHMHRYAGKTLLSEKYGDKYDRKCTFPYRKGMPRVPSSAGYFFRTTAFTAHRSALPGKLWFLEFCTRTFGALTFIGRGGVFGRPVIAVLGLSAACHHVGSTANGGILRPHTPLCRENSGF